MEWIRLYQSWASDPKIQRCSEIDQRRHVMIMLMRAEGILDTASDEDIAYFMRISDEDWVKTRDRFLDKNLIEHNDNGVGYDIPAWGRRQPKYDHSTERVKLWRKQHTCPDCKTVDKEVLLATDGKMVHCPICLGK